MPVKRRYLKIGHSDIRILPIVIDVEDEQWFAEEYSELLKLFNINSKLLLNFQTKQSISENSFGEESEDSSKRLVTKIIGKNFSFSYSLKENVEKINYNNDSSTAVCKVYQEEMCDVFNLLNFTLYCTVYKNNTNIPSIDKATCSDKHTEHENLGISSPQDT